jgi:predicted AAA+ superfamily ATPase
MFKPSLISDGDTPRLIDEWQVAPMLWDAIRFELSDVQRNPRRIKLLMRSMARNISTMASIESLRKDVSGSESELSAVTINTYLDILERLYVIENQPALRQPV